MNKNRRNLVLVVAGLIVLLGAIFLFISQGVFRSVTGQSYLSQRISQAESREKNFILDISETTLEESQIERWGNFVPYSPDQSEFIHTQPEGGISMDEAAQIGARYLYDFLGVSIEGMFVEMYFSNFQEDGGTWTGLVREDRESPVREVKYEFHISGENGWPLGLISNFSQKTGEFDIWIQQLVALEGLETTELEPLGEEDRQALTLLAQQVAELQFGTGQVMELRLEGRQAGLRNIITFTARDRDGAMISIEILEESQELRAIFYRFRNPEEEKELTQYWVEGGVRLPEWAEVGTLSLPNGTEVTLYDQQQDIRFYAGRLEPYHLTMEEAVLKAVEFIENDFDFVFDQEGFSFNMFLEQFSSEITWQGSLVDDQNNELFIFGIDPLTGRSRYIISTFSRLPLG